MSWPAYSYPGAYAGAPAPYAAPVVPVAPPPPPPLDGPDVPDMPEDRLDHAMFEYGMGYTRRVSDSPMLDDTRAHDYERKWGVPPPSPRNLHERGTASSNGKSVRVRATAR